MVLVNRVLSYGPVNWSHVSMRNYPQKPVMLLLPRLLTSSLKTINITSLLGLINIGKNGSKFYFLLTVSSYPEIDDAL